MEFLKYPSGHTVSQVPSYKYFPLQHDEQDPLSGPEQVAHGQTQDVQTPSDL